MSFTIFVSREEERERQRRESVGSHYHIYTSVTQESEENSLFRVALDKFKSCWSFLEE